MVESHHRRGYGPGTEAVLKPSRMSVGLDRPAAVVTASRTAVVAVATDAGMEGPGSASDAVDSKDTGASTVDRFWGRTVVPMPRLRRASFVSSKMLIQK